MMKMEQVQYLPLSMLLQLKPSKHSTLRNGTFRTYQNLQNSFRRADGLVMNSNIKEQILSTEKSPISPECELPVTHLNSSFEQQIGGELHSEQDNSLESRLKADYIALIFLNITGITWPRPKGPDYNRLQMIAYVTKMLWYCLTRIFAVALVIIGIFVTIFHTGVWNILIINSLVCFASILQGCSLFVAVGTCKRRLQLPVMENDLKYYQDTIPVCVFYFISCCCLILAMLGFLCPGKEQSDDAVTTMTFTSYFVFIIAQICVSSVLATCLMFIIGDNEMIRNTIKKQIDAAQQQTFTDDDLDSLRAAMKASSSSLSNLINWMTFIAILNSAAFVVSLYFTDKLRLAGCYDKVLLLLLVAMYFKEIVFLFLALLSASRVNEAADQLTYLLGSSRWQPEAELSRTVLFINLFTNPLSTRICGLRPTYRQLMLQLVGFAVATGIGIMRSMLDQRIGE